MASALCGVASLVRSSGGEEKPELPLCIRELHGAWIIFVRKTLGPTTTPKRRELFSLLAQSLRTGLVCEGSRRLFSWA
jgi:hypothetical protein